MWVAVPQSRAEGAAGRADRNPRCPIGVQGVRSSLHTFSYEHPYDVGLCGNLHESLGDSPLEWCLPPCGPAQGGTKYLTIFEQRALGL